MALLNTFFSFVGATAVTPLVTEPGAMWHVLILKAIGWIGDYGWSIVVFTLLLKLVLSPLDFYQRYKMHKNQKITERLKPTMEKMQKQYGDDKQAFAQKQMELNRREGYSYFSSCLPMIVTLVVFITLWMSMQTVARYMMFKEYTTMYDNFESAYSQIMEETGDSAGAKAAYDNTYAIWVYEPGEGDPEELTDDELELRRRAAADDAYNKVINDTGNKDLATSVGQDIVYKLYYDGLTDEYIGMIRSGNGLKTLDIAAHDSLNASFLWIKNIWSPDVPWGDKAIMTYEDFEKSVGDYAKATDSGLGGKHSECVNKAMYDRVMAKLLNDMDNSRTNGYLILPILVVVLSVASQIISSLQQKRAGQVNAKGGMATSMKVMMIIMPVMMAVFAVQYASIFTLYMVMNSATTLIFNFTFTSIIKAMDKSRRNRNYGISSGSPRTIPSADSPIIHYVKGANPNAGKREVPVADVDVPKKSKKDKSAPAAPAKRSGRPDPNELMNLDMRSSNNKKKK